MTFNPSDPTLLRSQRPLAARSLQGVAEPLPSGALRRDLPLSSRQRPGTGATKIGMGLWGFGGEVHVRNHEYKNEPHVEFELCCCFFLRINLHKNRIDHLVCHVDLWKDFFAPAE